MQTQALSWQAPPNYPHLSPDEVHVWRAHLTSAGKHIQALYQLLATDELRRAEHLHRTADRERFVIARGTLRLLIAAYLGVAPGAISFQYGQGGKPTLGTSASLQFNLTHSHNVALFAFTLDRRVGIDLEHISSNPDPLPAIHLLSPHERAALQQVTPEEQVAAFYRCWTRKEAYVKARGDGLTLPLDSFSVSLATSAPTALLNVCNDPEEPERWTLRSLHPAAGYAAAIAVEGKDWRLQCWDWSATVAKQRHFVTLS